MQPLTRRRLPVALALMAVLVGMAPGSGNGQNSGCTPGVSVDSPAAQSPGTPVRVTTGATVVCPTPESGGGGSFGPTKPPPPQGGPPNTPCTVTVLEPMELQLTGSDPWVFWPDPTFNGNGSDTPEPQQVSKIIGGIDARKFFEEAGTVDFFNPFILNGLWNNAGQCMPKDPKDPIASFQAVCNVAPIPITCLIPTTHTIGSGPLPIGALQGGLIDLRARMMQLIHPGQISAWPAQPNPALVNAPACFFIDGASIDGQDPRQPAEFQLVLLGPADATGRQVYYVFQIDIALQPDVQWTFGDAPGPGITEGLPPQCLGVSNAPLQFAHRYLRYSPPGGFPITATETYSLNVTEFWYDSGGQPNPPQPLCCFPPIVVNPGPAAGFSKVVIQEEGVPVGG